MKYERPIPVLLTVPHLNRTASPYREMMSILNLLPRSEFRLTVCALRDGGFAETAPVLKDLGIDCFVARFRPTGRSILAFRDSWRDQSIIDGRGPFAIQHSLDFTSSPFEALMSRLRSRAYVCSQRNLNQNGHSVLFRIKMSLCRRVIAISDAVQRFLLDRGVPLRKIDKIHLGIEVTYLSVERQRGYFLCVGQIEPLKRQHEAIRALSAVAQDFPEARLGIAGNVFDPEYMRSLQQLAGELGVADRVEFLGPRSDILHLMAKANGLIHCSESEAFGWVVLEAMSVGTPVIAAASEGPREIVEDGRTGILKNCGDVPGFAEGMRALIANLSLAERFSSEGRREVARRFSPAAMVDRIRKVYLECLGEEASPRALAAEASRNVQC